jgi:CD2 antigen cytoplasmic tail-binding protein 2
MSSRNKRSIRFSDSTKGPSEKRSRPNPDDDDDRKPAAAAVPILKTPRYKQRKANERPNEDEMDDIDDWNEREDGGDEDGDVVLPSEHELLEAKRRRRQQRSNALGGEDTQIDAETSLATEGVKIEPFHMRDEENDGSGYFDGDTYVFRKLAADDDGEPDAWADSLRDEDGNPTMEIARVPTADASTTKKKRSSQEDLDDLTKEQLYERILPLVSDSETVAKAIRRYGQLVKQQQQEKKRKKKEGISDSSDNNDDEDSNMAKSCLDELTGVSNALLLQGEVDIYDTTRELILRMFPDHKEGTNPTPKNVKWEYMGDNDNQLHGPFTTEQMLGWVKAGYFVGPQRVKIRYIQEKEEDTATKPSEPELSTKDDLLADLMDDDDDKDATPPPAKKAKTTSVIKGTWMWSNEVDYQKYL